MSQDRRVMVDVGGYLGNIFNSEFPLESLRDSQLGGDAFTTIFFRTSSGNIYKIVAYTSQKVVLYSASLNRGRGKHAEGYTFFVDELILGALRIGQGFHYGSGGSTSMVTEIVATTSRVYVPGYLEKITEGRKHAIRDEYERIVNAH